MIKAGLDLIGAFIVDKLIKSIDDLGHKTTGNLQSSLRYDVKESGSGFEIIIYGAEYAKAVDKGLPPGTKVSSEALAKWVEAKGIATGEAQIKGIAFLIQRKIFKEGTVQFRENKKGFIEVTLDANAKIIFKMVLDLFKTEFTLSLSNEIRKHKQTFQS
jgi:hypothetical protein